MTEYTFSYLEPEEVRAIINVVPSVSLHAEQDSLLLELLWQSGARVTEAIQFRPEHIGLTSVILRNLKQSKRVKTDSGVKKVKDEKAIKEVELSATLCQRLKDYCQKNNIQKGEYVFKGASGKGRAKRWYVWWMMTRASERAGVFRFGKNNPRTGKQLKGAYPHSLRHSNATKLLEETKDIMIVKQQLGHASVRTTQGYAYIRRPRIKREIARIEW